MFFLIPHKTIHKQISDKFMSQIMSLILWLTKRTCLIAEKKQMDVQNVVDEGPGLAFIVYPEVDELFF